MNRYRSLQLNSLMPLMAALLAVALWNSFFPATRSLLACQETEQQGTDQKNQQTSDSQGAGAISLDEDFLILRRKIREIDNQISNLFVNMPVGFPRQQQAQMAKVEQLKVTQADLRSKLDQAAIASFKADPQRNLQAANHIGQMLMASLEGKAIGKAYDPARALELTELLIENLESNPQYFILGYTAALATENFDRASFMLDKLAELGQVIEPKTREDFENLKQRWQAELEIREREAQANDLPKVRLELPEGMIEIELFENQAPETVANFISLVESGFYSGRSFFQVRPGQIARAGCPDDNGNGNPGYQIPQESVESPRNYFSGTLGMFHNGDGLAGSQFFVSYGPQADFEGRYVAFGRITEGLDILFSLDRTQPTSELISPPEKNLIIKAEVVRKRDHEYRFEKMINPILPSGGLGQLPGVGNESSGVRDVSPPDKKDQ